jgi:hypothetical protein
LKKPAFSPEPSDSLQETLPQSPQIQSSKAAEPTPEVRLPEQATATTMFTCDQRFFLLNEFLKQNPSFREILNGLFEEWKQDSENIFKSSFCSSEELKSIVDTILSKLTTGDAPVFNSYVKTKFNYVVPDVTFETLFTKDEQMTLLNAMREIPILKEALSEVRLPETTASLQTFIGPIMRGKTPEQQNAIREILLRKYQLRFGPAPPSIKPSDVVDRSQYGPRTQYGGKTRNHKRRSATRRN